MMKRVAFILLLAAGAAMFSACGYSLSARNTAVPRGEPINVRMFANRTYVPDIEGKFRLALVSELVGRGQIVGGDSANYVVTGEILSLNLETTAFSAVDVAMINRMTLGVRMQLSERKSGKTIWNSSEVVRQEYPANPDLTLQRNAYEEALSAVCARGARLLAERMNQSF